MNRRTVVTTLVMLVILGECQGGLAARARRSDDASLGAMTAAVAQQAALVSALQARLDAADAKLANHDARLTSAENTVQAKLGNPVAFTVRFSKDPVTVGTGAILRFDAVATGLGGGFDAKAGIFTAPVAGTYAFYVNLMMEQDQEGEVKLMRNGAVLDYALGNGSLDQGTLLTTVQLAGGDNVWVQHHWSGTHFRGGHWTVFSGFLIAAN